MRCSICKKSIDSHEAGRPVDRCVAEKLGKFVEYYTPNGRTDLGDYFEIINAGQHSVQGGEVIDHTDYIPIPHFSSDIASAFPLLDKLFESDPYINIDMRIRKKIIIIEIHLKDGVIRVKAPTAPLAITKAFLVAEGE